MPTAMIFATFDEALGYAKERVLFGRPLAATQSAQIKLAEMARRITTAQLLEIAEPLRKSGYGDYLAAKAMQAMSGGIWPDANERPEIAKRAYALADEMLKARAAKATGDAS